MFVHVGVEEEHWLYLVKWVLACRRYPKFNMLMWTRNFQEGTYSGLYNVIQVYLTKDFPLLPSFLPFFSLPPPPLLFLSSLNFWLMPSLLLLWSTSQGNCSIASTVGSAQFVNCKINHIQAKQMPARLNSLYMGYMPNTSEQICEHVLLFSKDLSEENTCQPTVCGYDLYANNSKQILNCLWNSSYHSHVKGPVHWFLIFYC